MRIAFLVVTEGEGGSEVARWRATRRAITGSSRSDGDGSMIVTQRMVCIAALLLPGWFACGVSHGPLSASWEVEGRSAGRARPAAEAVRRPTLYVEPSSYDFAHNPALLARITGRPHGYFRFINIRFAQAVCERFRGEMAGMPAVNLHGDAHVEQYAVTGHGRGLTDFDDSASGPAVVDLVRFGVSLTLAARQHGWDDRAGELVDAFLAGYRSGLAAPARRARAPVVVRRMRASFAADRTALLNQLDRIATPIDFDPAVIELALAGYAERIHAEQAGLPRSYFDPRMVGRLHIGVGSALDEKYIIRVEGRSPAPDDDLVLEAKELRKLDGIECLDVSRRFDPFRIMVVQARIAYTPYRHVGYAHFRDKTFWIHAWEDNYIELAIDQTLRTVQDLREVAVDVGVQLGRGHAYQIANPLERELRRELRVSLDRYQPIIRQAVTDLSREVVIAWDHFRREVARAAP